MSSSEPPVLVTGASSGIGRAITEFLSAKGVAVYATARKGADLKELGRIPNVTPVRLDVRKPEEVRRAAAVLSKGTTRLRGLVNNAGIADAWPLPETRDEDLWTILDVNLFGVHRMVRAFLPHLVAGRGRIVNMSSISGLGTSRMIGAYSVTKHALEAYSEVLAGTLGRYGVKVSLVEPGNFRSDIWSNAARTVRRRSRSVKGAVMQDEIRKTFKEFETDEDPDTYPTPEPVAEAVADALFAKDPRFRYVVAPDLEEFRWPAESLIWRAIQAAEGIPHRLTREDLHGMIDRFWERASREPMPP